METSQFAGNVQTQTVPRDILPGGAAVEPLEDVFLRRRRNRPTCVADGQKHRLAVFPDRDPEAASRAVVLPRVFQQIPHDESRVTFLAGDGPRRGKVRFQGKFERVGLHPEVVQLGFDELGEIHRRQGQLQPAGIHP